MIGRTGLYMLREFVRSTVYERTVWRGTYTVVVDSFDAITAVWDVVAQVWIDDSNDLTYELKAVFGADADGNPTEVDPRGFKASLDSDELNELELRLRQGVGNPEPEEEA